MIIDTYGPIRRQWVIVDSGPLYRQAPAGGLAAAATLLLSIDEP